MLQSGCAVIFFEELEEAEDEGEKEKEEESEEQEESEWNVAGSKGYWVVPWDPLVYTHKGDAVENRGKIESLILISESYVAEGAVVEGREEILEDLDISEEGICYSGPLEKLYGMH